MTETLEIRGSFRLAQAEWDKFKEQCYKRWSSPSAVLRSFVSAYNQAEKGGTNLTDEDFVYTYVDWLEGMTFQEAYALAVDRDGEAANELLYSTEMNTE